jgi:hypothetical protein
LTYLEPVLPVVQAVVLLLLWQSSAVVGQPGAVGQVGNNIALVPGAWLHVAPPPTGMEMK